MKSTFNICFYAKKDKQKAGGAYPLFARITVDGVASRFNTKLDVLPEMWDGKAGKARTHSGSRTYQPYVKRYKRIAEHHLPRNAAA